MRYQVILDNELGTIQPDNFDVETHKSSTNLVPVLEVFGGSGCKKSALSCHCTYLATLTHTHLDSSALYITNLIDNRWYMLKKLVDACSVLYFHPYHESWVFVATASCKLYCINVDDGSTTLLKGHQVPVSGVQCGVRSAVVVSYNTHEALLWSWPSLTLTSRLRLLDQIPVVWAGHIWQREEVVAGFSTGTVMVWPGHQRNNHIYIEPPHSLHMQFEAFALSRCGEWMVGGGKGSLVVTYSLATRCLTQVLQLPGSCPSLNNPLFLPPIYPKYSQVLAVQGSASVLSIIDFTSCTKLKTLRSQRHDIDCVSVSEDGGLTCVTYSSGVAKIYPTRSLLPPQPTAVSVLDIQQKEIAFQIIEKREKEKEKEQKKMDKRNEMTKELEELLDKNKWYRVLREFGQYPDKYRRLIWVSVLQLPRNYSVLSVLLDKRTHPAFEGLEDQFTLIDQTLFRALQRTLSCLAHWSPFLAEVTYLPHLLFPFIKYLHNNLLLCFEISVTLILNWCRLWFEFWPRSGVTVLNATEQLLCDHDPTLLAHLIRLRVTAQHYAWTPLISAFSVVLSDSDWLTLWDHILSNPPSYLICVTVAFTLHSRSTLLSCTDATQVKTYYQQETWVSVRDIINTAYDLHQGGRRKGGDKDEKGTNRHKSLLRLFGKFTPLPPAGLPLFTVGPRDAAQEEIEILDEMCQGETDTNNTNTPSNFLTHTSWEKQQQKQQREEEMVYVVGRSELQQQEEQCLDSIINLRKRHLATSQHQQHCTDKLT